MTAQRMSTENVERFINEQLKEDLRVYEKRLKELNAEMLEYVQLKHMIETILTQENRSEFKTQVNVGGNMFIKARAENVDHILVDVGLKVYVEFKIEEAIRYVEMKIKVLTKEADIVREKSIETRANIKLALLVIGDAQQLHKTQDDR
ncbi:protein UXT homolog [Anopheles maculipalpis]|uniref:protein UXT homolog n=1 Tax=Anopheles maculipalpis TaxID=1496333 RepID=UPI0021595C6C|nr:protein UXT homolog [Anopheles maculipalpis]